jgi:hypothetical protein
MTTLELMAAMNKGPEALADLQAKEVHRLEDLVFRLVRVVERWAERCPECEHKFPGEHAAGCWLQEIFRIYGAPKNSD